MPSRNAPIHRNDKNAATAFKPGIFKVLEINQRHTTTRGIVRGKKCRRSIGSLVCGILTWPRASTLQSSAVAFGTNSFSVTVYTKWAILEPGGKHQVGNSAKKAGTPTLWLFAPPAPWESPIHKALALFDAQDSLLSRKSPVSLGLLSETISNNWLTSQLLSLPHQLGKQESGQKLKRKVHEIKCLQGTLELHAPLWGYVKDQGRSASPLIS